MLAQELAWAQALAQASARLFNSITNLLGASKRAAFLREKGRTGASGQTVVWLELNLGLVHAESDAVQVEAIALAFRLRLILDTRTRAKNYIAAALR